MRIREGKNKKFNPFSIKEDGALKVEGYSYRLEWADDSYVSGTGRNEVVGRTFSSARLSWILAGVLILFFVILARAAWLQIVKGEYYYSMAEGNRIRIERVEAKRGIIYDKNLNPLVRNVFNFLLYLVPVDLPREEVERERILEKISKVSEDLSVDYLKDLLAEIKPGSLEAYQPLFVKDKIDYEKAISLYLESSQMPGVVITNKSRREYNLHSLSLSHILGYVGNINKEELKRYGDEYLPIDYIGKMGLEYFWENELKGINGRKQIEVDALGKEKKIISAQGAEDGHNLITSLDIELQQKIEEILNEALKKLKTKRASAIALDPNSGEILALVSLPAYDNNVFTRGITGEEYKTLVEHPDKPLFNRSISGEYPPGSTFKPIMAAAALEEKIISEWTSFNSAGGIRIGQWFFPDWAAGGHGLTDVRRAIAWSVNTFFYIIGGGYEDFEGLGVNKIVNYAKEFGLGEQTGIDLAGESSGFLPSKEWKEEAKGEKWYIGDTYHLSIGQGDILVTPLQVAVFTSVFANGGKLYRPHIVRQILSGDDEFISDISTEPVKENFIDDYNMKVARQGMRQTVTSGSAQSLQYVPVEVAGKTGTAQWSEDGENHAWFTGFAPYDNPEIVITILIEEGGEGSQVAVPVAREVLNWYFSNREL